MRPTPRYSKSWKRLCLVGCALALLAWMAEPFGRANPSAPAYLGTEYSAHVRPLMTQYCLTCHSHKLKKGDLDLERFTSMNEVRQDLPAWQLVLEMLGGGDMPPKKAPQPTPEERRQLLTWVRGTLAAEANAKAGDPGRVVLRRLSNAEYNNTIRDLTTVDLQPARDFPVDGAAGEGFTNTGDALVISPTLLGKYLNSAKEIAGHAVLLPDGFRFSPSKTRRDWTDEVVAELHKFYAPFSSDGRLPLRPYVAVAVRYREELRAGHTTLAAVAAKENLNLKYFQILWQVLTDVQPSFPLDLVRVRWRQAQPKDVDALVAEIAGWQEALWRFQLIGSQRYGQTVRQIANNPAQTQSLRLQIKPEPGQTDVVVYLAAREFPTSGPGSNAVWHRPRFEGVNQVNQLLRDAAQKAGTPTAVQYGLDRARFVRSPGEKNGEEDSLVVPANSVVEVRLPVALFRDRDFVVEARLDPAGSGRVGHFQVTTAPPKLDVPFDGKAPLVVSSGGEEAKQLIQGFDAFRSCFPKFLFYARVIPDDEVISLKLFHREDEPLIRLFLADEAKQRLDRLWSELRFISQYPIIENKQLPLFIGFVSQDQPKEMLNYFESQREPYRQRAEAFEKELEAAAPRQLQALAEFADRAYRRPLRTEETAELTHLYGLLRQKGMAHEEAFRTVLTRVLISPSFLFRIEQAGPGKEAQPVSQQELASRLSYFLWATMPDAELRQVAAEGRLQDPQVLSAQVTRMLKDPKVRGLAVEFATQWLHVRDLRESREKNEKLFPTFDETLRDGLFEEAVLFCQNLFRNDRPLRDVLDADYTFLNDNLARHYGIPSVVGPEWRLVTGVKKYGRGGVLTLGSVLTKQSGASRTSPILRGNWLLETVLGEKLPKPPPNVPLLPEEEKTSDATVRQLVEKHTRLAQCAVCHQRIDPFGFALEQYDPIGRFRDKDLGGRPIDTKVRLKDGTQFEGVDGLRAYLLMQRQQDFQRYFCQKLLGYALGRSVTLTDQPLVEEMLNGLKNDGRLSAAVQTIVRSQQFRYHRGVEATKDE